MSLPQLIVEVGFTGPGTGNYLHLGDRKRGLLGTGTLAPVNLLTDISESVVSVTIRRGATRGDAPTLRYDAGTCTIVLRNDDRRFDPTNLAGPYVAGGVTQVEPMRLVRVRARYAQQSRHLFRGFADEWQVAYDGPNSSYATLTCKDAFMVLASHDRGAQVAVGAGENAGARISRILDSVGWSSVDRDVDTGDTTLQATTLAGPALSESQVAADSELGELYVDATGRVAFRHRLAVQDDARSAYPQAAFGDSPDEGVATTINLVANPSIETGTTGWEAGGGVGTPTLAKSGTRAKYGSNSLLVTWATGGFLPHARYTITGLSPGRTYTGSVWAYVPAGNPRVICIVSDTNHFGGETTAFDTWQRITWTGVAPADGEWSFQVWPMGTTTAGQVCYLDGLQVEEGSEATDYVDGDQADGEWDGVPHASTSRRLPEMEYADLQIAYDTKSIYNLFRVAIAGGTEQIVEDAASRTAYLTRSAPSRSDLMLQTDAAAKLWAEVLREQHSMPELRFSGMQLKPLKDPERLFPQVLNRELGDRVRGYRRPPGGGSTIARDVYVRGITHTTDGEDWTTDWVFQAAPDIERIADSFTRVESSGWGNADSGHAWVHDVAPASDYSTNNIKGVISLSTLNSERRMAVYLGHAGQDVTVWGPLVPVPTGAAINWGALLRRADSDNYYWIDVQVGTDSSLTLRLVKRVAGVVTQVTTAATGVTHSTTVQRVLRARALGTRIEAKVWASDAAEPSSWQMSFTDGSLRSGKSVGVIARLMTGNTNAAPVLFGFDNFSATSLHVWT